jgi:hypothetical protein
MRASRALPLLALAACGGGQPAPAVVSLTPPPTAEAAAAPRPPEASAPTAPVGGGIAIVPLRITSPGKAGALEVTSDGKILVDGRVRARFAGSDVLDDEGKTLVHVGSDGAITVTPPEGAPPSDVVPRSARFGARDEIVVDGGGWVRVGDGGAVTYSVGNSGPRTAPLSVQGFTPAAKRELALLFVLLTLPAKTPSAAPPGSG